MSPRLQGAEVTHVHRFPMMLDNHQHGTGIVKAEKCSLVKTKGEKKP